ncbi:small GTP-binding [Micractinium conductrix]|uniref:Small GTP-binding n=1 Tax=Micractinium conductrix TaxID=554055 RepID=A0A2P6V9W3_9CHLO|nr:small GTP-binding [Micractinium conductrix]|eukprot:PSC70886.1 small GTP-binding [Micractinium conductrix]
MPGKDGGKAKPLKAAKKVGKDYDESDVEFLKKKKEEAAALKAAKEALAKGKKKQRLQLTAVCRSWRRALSASRTLWAVATLDLSQADEKRLGSMLAYATSRTEGIRELELTLNSDECWPEVAFMLGCLRPGLRRLCVAAANMSCELPAGGAAFLPALRGLTSLDLDNCLEEVPAGLSRLTGLQELLISRDELSYTGFEVPAELGKLTALTRLELVRCCSHPLPPELGRLSRLRLLNLEGSDLFETPNNLAHVLSSMVNLEELDLGGCNLLDVPSSLLLLTSLTTLSLDNSFASQAWSTQTWEDKLSCLGSLHRLMYLELTECDLPVVPRSVAGLRKLETLKLGLNCIGEEGLVEGPYLASLLHLDLRGGRFEQLPQHLVRAQRLQHLGLSCCHDLVLDRALAEGVVGKLRALTCLSLCGQQMHSIDSARFMLALGRMLPGVEVTHHSEEDEGEEGEEDDGGATSDEDSAFDSEEGESEWEEEGEDAEDGEGSGEDGAETASEGGGGSDADSVADWHHEELDLHHVL